MSNSILVPQYGMGITQREMGLRRKWIDEPHHLDRYRLVMPVVPVFTRHFLNMIEAYNGNFELRPSDNFENSKLYGKRVRNLYDYFVIGNNGGSDTFLDAYFEPNEDGFMGLQVKSEHRFECGTVVAKNVELLEECLDQICFADLGFIKRAALPATSFVEPRLEVMTGQLHAIASRIGSPKPSYKEGYKKEVARL